jgi:chromosome segregation ATPase
MADIHDDRIVEVGVPGWIAPAIVILALVAIAGLGLAWYDSSQLQAAQQSFGNEMKAAQQNTAQQIATLEQKETQADAANTELQGDLGVVTKRLRITQGDLKKSRDEAAQIRDESAQKIAQMDTDVKSQLATKASSDDLNATNGTVNGVKTDLEGTKSDLKMARSELGTLIARNHDEIDSLRRMGEREYVEFTITGRNKPQRIGNISAQLRSVDVKKNKFTVALMVDDLNTEKKDRTVNEPIVFYENGSHQADEFVVNSVSKDKISGYISMPKNPGRTAAAVPAGN